MMTEVWLLYSAYNDLIGVFSSEEKALDHAVGGDILHCVALDKDIMTQRDKFSYVVSDD